MLPINGRYSPLRSEREAKITFQFFTSRIKTRSDFFRGDSIWLRANALFISKTMLPPAKTERYVFTALTGILKRPLRAKRAWTPFVTSAIQNSYACAEKGESEDEKELNYRVYRYDLETEEQTQLTEFTAYYITGMDDSRIICYGADGEKIVNY